MARTMTYAVVFLLGCGGGRVPPPKPPPTPPLVEERALDSADALIDSIQAKPALPCRCEEGHTFTRAEAERLGYVCDVRPYAIRCD